MKYIKFISTDENMRKEWEEMDPQVKKSVENLLHQYTEKMTLSASIDLLCNLFLDLQERIEKLEKTNK